MGNPGDVAEHKRCAFTAELIPRKNVLSVIQDNKSVTVYTFTAQD